MSIKDEHTPQIVCGSFGFIVVCTLLIFSPPLGLGVAILIFAVMRHTKTSATRRREAYLAERRATWGY